MVKKTIFTILGITIPVALMGGLFAYAIPILNVHWYDYVDASENLTKIETSPITYHDLGQQAWNNTDAKKAMPAEGEVNLLCIPIEFSDSPFEESALEDLENLFNGESEKTGYWESVSSYYEKSSFGKLKIDVEVADVYYVDEGVEEFASSKDPTSLTNLLVRQAVKKTYEDHPDWDYSSFDADQNGYFDGLYLVYSCPDFAEAMKDQNSYYYKTPSKQENFEKLYWAYTAWNTATITGNDIPIKPNAYVWASYDFMYKAVSSPKVDGHTFIHETGHLLGLADYYNSVSEEEASTFGKYAHYMPCGGLQMMDHNIGDFDAWTKFSLGWSSAYIVDKNKPFPQTFELKDSSLTGDLLLIPAIEDDSYENIEDYNAFGEYIALELYSPTGLNALDSKITYSRYGYLGNYPPMYSITGVRASHIDSRLSIGASYQSPKKADVEAASGHSCYSVLAHNLLTEASSATYGEDWVYWLNQLIESGGEESLVSENSFADNETLFKGNDRKGDFSMSRFSAFFTRKDDNGNPLFNNGKNFGYTFRINGERMKDGVRTVSITVDKEVA